MWIEDLVMATDPKVEPGAGKNRRVVIPPPVPDGEDHLESLGRFVDNFLGDARVQAAADHKVARIVDKAEAPDDPPPVEIPEPLPEGDETFTEGKDLVEGETHGA